MVIKVWKTRPRSRAPKPTRSNTVKIRANSTSPWPFSCRLDATRTDHPFLGVHSADLNDLIEMIREHFNEIWIKKLSARVLYKMKRFFLGGFFFFFSFFMWGRGEIRHNTI